MQKLIKLKKNKAFLARLSDFKKIAKGKVCLFVGGQTMEISKGEYVISCVARDTLVNESTLMDDPYFIEVAKEIIKHYPDVEDVVIHFIDWVNENY